MGTVGMALSGTGHHLLLGGWQNRCERLAPIFLTMTVIGVVSLWRPCSDCITSVLMTCRPARISSQYKPVRNRFWWVDVRLHQFGTYGLRHR